MRYAIPTASGKPRTHKTITMMVKTVEAPMPAMRGGLQYGRKADVRLDHEWFQPTTNTSPTMTLEREVPQSTALGGGGPCPGGLCALVWRT